MHTEKIDMIYIIVSSEFEKDRLSYLTNYFENNKIDIPITYYEPFYKNRDEGKIDFERYAEIKIPEIMLMYTYEKLFEEIIEKDYKYVLTLESDVLFHVNFKEKLDVIFTEWISKSEHPSVVFLGNGVGVKLLQETKISKNLYEMNVSKCTDSMLFDRKMVIYMYDKIKKSAIISCPVDRLFDNFIGLETYGYWIEDPIITQGSQNGTYESTIQNVFRRRNHKRNRRKQN